MKKILNILIVLLCCFALTACDEDKKLESQQNNSQVVEQGDNVEQQTQENNNDNNTVVDEKKETPNKNQNNDSSTKNNSATQKSTNTTTESKSNNTDSNSNSSTSNNTNTSNENNKKGETTTKPVEENKKQEDSNLNEDGVDMSKYTPFMMQAYGYLDSIYRYKNEPNEIESEITSFEESINTYKVRCIDKVNYSEKYCTKQEPNYYDNIENLEKLKNKLVQVKQENPGKILGLQQKAVKLMKAQPKIHIEKFTEFYSQTEYKNVLNEILNMM